MTRLDQLAAGSDAKRTAMLFSDARSVLGKVDVLMAVASAVEDLPSPRSPPSVTPPSTW